MTGFYMKCNTRLKWVGQKFNVFNNKIRFIKLTIRISQKQQLSFNKMIFLEEHFSDISNNNNNGTVDIC